MSQVFNDLFCCVGFLSLCFLFVFVWGIHCLVILNLYLLMVQVTRICFIKPLALKYMVEYTSIILFYNCVRSTLLFCSVSNIDQGQNKKGKTKWRFRGSLKTGMLEQEYFVYRETSTFRAKEWTKEWKITFYSKTEGAVSHKVLYYQQLSNCN